MYYELVSSFKFHPDAYLEETNSKSIQIFMDAPYESFIKYNGKFIANDFPPDSLCFVDFVQTLSGVPVFSSKVKKLFHDLKIEDIRFNECTLLYAGHNIMESIGNDTGPFFMGKVKNRVDIINEEVTPMHFWPTLKKFKMENYVIDKKMNENFLVAVDEKLPTMIIASKQFVDLCKKHNLKMDFNELPIAIGVERKR